MAQRDSDKNDWRTRGNPRDEERKYDDNYNQRGSYSRGRGPRHPKRGNRNNRYKDRPASSNSYYRDERDGYGYGSDNSTCSEPPFNDRKHSKVSDKPFSKDPSQNIDKNNTEPAPKTRANSNQSNSQNSNKSKPQTQTISKEEKKVQSAKTDNLETPNKAEPGSKTDKPAGNDSSAKSNSQEKITNKNPIAPKPTVPNKDPPPPPINKSTSLTIPTLPPTGKQEQAYKPPDKKANAPPNQEANISSAQGRNKPQDQKTTTPIDFKANAPSNLGAKIPPDQGTNNILPPAQGENKLPIQKENIPGQNIIPITNPSPTEHQNTTNSPDEKTTPTPSNPSPPQIPISLPDSNNDTTNQNTGPQSTTQPQGITSSTTQSLNLFQPTIGFSMRNLFQIPSLTTSIGSVPPFQENNNIPGPVTNPLFFQSNTVLMNKGQEKSENIPGVNPITQGNSQEVSQHSQLIDKMSPVQTSGKPPNNPPDNTTTLQHPPTDNKTSGEDISEANNNQNLIKTRPSNQLTAPTSGAKEATYSDSGFKSLPGSSILSTSMSEKDPSQLLEKDPSQLSENMKQLNSELDKQTNKAIEAEKKEKSLITENKNLKADITQINNDSEQRKEENIARDKDKQKVSNELQTEKQKVASLESEKKKTTDELKASKKECEQFKGQVQQYTTSLANTKSQTENLNKDQQSLTTKLAEFESKNKNTTKELEAKQREFAKLKETHSIEIKNLKKTMEVSKAGDNDSVNEQRKKFEANESKQKQIEEELQSAQATITVSETKRNANMQEITLLKQQTAQLTNEEIRLKEIISHFQIEKDHYAARMNSCVDIALLTKIEEVFIGLSKHEPPPEYTLGSPDRVEWLVSSLTSWNAQLSENISDIQSLLHEKETEIDIHKEELQAILNFLQQHKPTNKSWTTSSTSSPFSLIQGILTQRSDQLAKASVCKFELERYNKTMEIQIAESRQHYKDESKKNDQLMQDNADLERRVQGLTSEKEELEIKNVELINQLSGQSDIDNFNDPSLQLHSMNPTFVQELLHSRPSPLPLGMVSPFPFEAPPSPPPSAFSLSQAHRSTLQKAADELSHLKVRVWESEAENSKLREQLSVRNRDPSLPATASPDAESAFQAVFEANQLNLVKLAESNREKDLLCRDVEFLRQRVEELEKNIERHKISIDVKEVAYKELYSECREWERKYKKCGHVHQEMERVKRQLMRRESETQECATLRAERLNQQTTLDNLVAELQERKKAEQILSRENQKLHARLEETLQHISTMQSRIQEQTIIEPHRNPKPEEIQHHPVPHLHPVSPTILKPPSMSSVPLSPPTRQPATKRHPPILYPPTNS